MVRGEFAQAGRRQYCRTPGQARALDQGLGGEYFEIAEGELVVLENCRINKGEKKNADETAKKYAALCDVFVMDAFGTAHRAQASTYGIAKYAPIACAGILLTEELDALTKALLDPGPPYGCDSGRFQGLHKADRTGIPCRRK